MGRVLEAGRGCRGDRRGEGYEAVLYEAAAGGAGGRCRDCPGDDGVGGSGAGDLAFVGLFGGVVFNSRSVHVVFRIDLR